MDWSNRFRDWARRLTMTRHQLEQEERQLKLAEETR